MDTRYACASVLHARLASNVPTDPKQKAGTVDYSVQMDKEMIIHVCLVYIYALLFFRSII